MAINQPGVRTNVPTAQAHQQGPIPLPLVATLPPAAQAQQNQQLLAQFPRLRDSLEAAAPDAPASPVAVVIAPLGKSTNCFEIKVHTSGAGDASASQAVSSAVAAYIIRRCGGDVVQSTLGGITLKPLDGPARAKVDAALQELNTLGALVQHLGGNAQTFTKLLERPDWAADLQAFTGDQPKVALQQVGNKVLVVVNPHADVDSLVAAARLLFAANGNEQAMSLLCEALLKSDDSNSSAVTQQFVAGLSKGHFPASASRATKALIEVAVTEWFHVTGKDFAVCMNKAVQALFAAGYPQGASSLVIRAAHGQCPIGHKIALLKIVFDVALQVRDTRTASFALGGLAELGDDAQAVHAECVEQVKVSNQLATMEWSPHRQALEQAGFKFEFGFHGALTSQSNFDPAAHTDALLGYAAELVDASLDPHFTARFAAPVAEFLIGHFAALPQAAKLELARICANLIDKAGPTVQKLQQAIEAELLQSAITAAKQAGSPKASVNALVWLLGQKDQLFGSLQSAGTDVEKMITAALLELGVPEDFEHTIDEKAARATLKTAMSPTFDILLDLFKNSSLACTSPLTQASRLCFAAVNTASFELVQMRHQLDALPLQSEEQWQKLQQAFQEVFGAMKHMMGATPAQLASVHGSVIDAIVELAERGTEGSVRGVMSWCSKALEALENDQAMLASVSKADPRAVQWLSMAVISVTLPSKRATEQSSMLGEFEAICRGPGATLDRRLDAAIRLLLKALLEHRDPQLRIVPQLQVSQAVQLVVLHASLAAHEAAWVDAQPLPLTCLGSCTDFYKGQLKPSRRPDPERGDLNVLRGILTELSRHDVQLAQKFLSELTQIPGGEFGPSMGASLAFIGYVHLANLLHAKNDAKGMLQMLMAALAHLPTDGAERHRVLPAFSDFIKKLRQVRELPDPLARLMREKGL